MRKKVCSDGDENRENFFQFGFNRKEQLTRIILFALIAALTAGRS